MGERHCDSGRTCRHVRANGVAGPCRGGRSAHGDLGAQGRDVASLRSRDGRGLGARAQRRCREGGPGTRCSTTLGGRGVQPRSRRPDGDLGERTPRHSCQAAVRLRAGPLHAAHGQVPARWRTGPGFSDRGHRTQRGTPDRRHGRRRRSDRLAGGRVLAARLDGRGRVLYTERPWPGAALRVLGGVARVRPVAPDRDLRQSARPPSCGSSPRLS